jgi:hypothetical protein
VQALAPPVEPGQLPRDWQNPDVLFLGPVLNEVDIPAWKRTTRARLVALGVQGFLREAGQDDGSGTKGVRPRLWNPDEEELKGVDVACLSDEDLIGQADLLDRLCDLVPVVALTRERKGCDIITAENKVWVGIHPARQVDPTGAGDTFAAGFLLGLACGQSPGEAARLGSACASIVIEGLAGENIPRMQASHQRAKKVTVEMGPVRS